MKIKHPEKVAGCECSYCTPQVVRAPGRVRQWRLRAEVWLKSRGVGFYPIQRGQRWFLDAGKIGKFWGLHVRRLGIAVTWRAK